MDKRYIMGLFRSLILFALIGFSFHGRCWSQVREELELNELQDELPSSRNKIQRIRGNLLFEEQLYEYSDKTLHHLVSPNKASKQLMEFKIATKFVSVLAMTLGSGIFLYYTGQAMYVDGVGYKTRGLRKNALITAGLGFGGFLIQIPLSNISISIFNE